MKLIPIQNCECNQIDGVWHIQIPLRYEDIAFNVAANGTLYLVYNLETRMTVSLLPDLTINVRSDNIDNIMVAESFGIPIDRLSKKLKFYWAKK
jgi:hypothetical protein